MTKRIICVVVGGALSAQFSFAEEKPAQDFFNAINWEVKYLDPNTKQNQSDNGTFGLAYDVDYDFLEGSNNRIAFIGKGLIAAEKSANPKNFLESEIDIGVEKEWKVPTPYEEICPQGMAEIECKAIKKSARKQQNITVASFNLDASYESNQDFSQKQLAYGANLTFKFRGYSNANYIFDAPFMLTRLLSNHSLSTEPNIQKTYRGVTPTLKIALEKVDPKDDDARQAVLGNKDVFDRWHVDVGMTTPMAKVNGKEVVFNYVWRYFEEIDAKHELRSAGLDKFKYSSVGFVYDGKVYVSYSSGKLPLSNKDDKVFELGWKFNFGSD